MAGDKSSVTFSPREMEVLALSWQCMESQPKIDMNKLAMLTGYTPGSASVTFGKIKTKLKALGESLSAAPPPPITPKKVGGPGRGKKGATSATSTPKSGTKRGAGTTAGAGTPSKRCKKGTGNGGGGGAAGLGSDEEDDELSDDMYTRIKKEKIEDNDDDIKDEGTFFAGLRDAADAFGGNDDE